MSLNLPDFLGDETDAEANEWLRTIRKTLVADRSLSTADREKGYLEIFEFSFPANSQAADWWNSLSAATKTSWTNVETEFKTRWPAPQMTQVTDAQRTALLFEHMKSLKPAALLLRTTIGKREEWNHVIWANDLESLARKAKVLVASSQILVAQLREQLPPALVEAIGDQDAVWDTTLDVIVKKIREVDIKVLGRKVAGQKTIAQMDEMTSLLQNLHTSTPQPQPHALRTRPSTASLAAPNSQPPSPRSISRPISRPPSYHSANNYTPPAVPQPAPRAPSYRHAPSPFLVRAGQASAPVNPAVVVDLFPTTVDAHRASVTQWMARWGKSVEPDTTRPYPITPGTADPRQYSCFQCGKADHGRANCTAPGAEHLPVAEQSYRVAVFRSRGQGRVVAVSEVVVDDDAIYFGASSSTGVASGNGGGSV